MSCATLINVVMTRPTFSMLFILTFIFTLLSITHVITTDTCCREKPSEFTLQMLDFQQQQYLMMQTQAAQQIQPIFQQQAQTQHQQQQVCLPSLKLLKTRPANQSAENSWSYWGRKRTCRLSLSKRCAIFSAGLILRNLLSSLAFHSNLPTCRRCSSNSSIPNCRWETACLCNRKCSSSNRPN